MSQDEQDLIFCRILREHDQAVKQLALLDYKQEKIGRAFQAMGAAIVRGVMPEEEYLFDFCSLDELRQLLAEIALTADRIRSLQGRLKRFHVQPED